MASTRPQSSHGSAPVDALYIDCELSQSQHLHPSSAALQSSCAGRRACTYIVTCRNHRRSDRRRGDGVPPSWSARDLRRVITALRRRRADLHIDCELSQSQHLHPSSAALQSSCAGRRACTYIVTCRNHRRSDRRRGDGVPPSWSARDLRRVITALRRRRADLHIDCELSQSQHLHPSSAALQSSCAGRRACTYIVTCRNHRRSDRRRGDGVDPSAELTRLCAGRRPVHTL
jgi:hypothetical protein